jgi:undecaprenyl diphosphate synthase
LAQAVRGAIDLTRSNTRITLTLAFNYGGRAEIVHAIRLLVADGHRPEFIDEQLVERYLYTAGMPDPDLVVRTSGELRTSNFLIWQASFAEYHFTPVYWPDFGPQELDIAVADFAGRERRFGGLLDTTSSDPVKL